MGVSRKMEKILGKIHIEKGKFKLDRNSKQNEI
jgi:hypothetical protein